MTSTQPSPLAKTTAEQPINPSTLTAGVRSEQVSGQMSHSEQTPSSTGGESATRTKTSAEEAADRLYEENIQLEYEKREGGA